jgi:molybdopterin molybdotransferase
MLTSLLKNQQVEIINSGIIEDSEEKIKLALKRLIDEKVDLIVTTGGVSMGAYDYVRKVIEDQGSLEFWRVNIKPGKPLAFGYLEKTPIIGLPGNPVSAYVGFHVFILPVINKLAGKEYHPPFLIQAKLQSKLQSNTRESYIPAYVESDHHQHTVSPVKNQSSGNLFSLVLTNALIILPGGVEFFNEGDMVNVWKINCNNI